MGLRLGFGLGLVLGLDWVRVRVTKVQDQDQDKGKLLIKVPRTELSPKKRFTKKKEQQNQTLKDERPVIATRVTGLGLGLGLGSRSGSASGSGFGLRVRFEGNDHIFMIIVHL